MTTHGEARSLAYRCWVSMIQRCSTPTNKSYQYYGARGIKVCDRWRYGEGGRSGYECFASDMGRRPTDSHSLDRVDNDGDYEPGNCRWATKVEQRANRRDSVRAALGLTPPPSEGEA